VQAFRERLGSTIQSALQSRVAPSSIRRYALAWRRWCEFIPQFISDPGEQDFTPTRLGTHGIVHMLLHFVSHLASDLHLSSPNITNTLAGLRHHFLARLVPVAAFQHETLTALKTSLARNPAHAPAFRGRRLPYTLNMVRYIMDINLAEGSIATHMIAVATMTAFVCLLRASEYSASTRDTNHALSASAVEFQCLLPGWSTTQLIPAYEAARMPALTFDHVQLVRITIHTAKNIRAGAGHTLWFSATPSADTSVDLPVARHLFEWTRRAQPGPADYFFSYRSADGSYHPLTYRMMTDTIKACAEQFGFDARLFATHSLRIGAASTLRANEAPNELIQLLGRWRSTPVSLDYQDRSSASYDLLLQLLLAPGMFSEQDIRLGRILPQHQPARAS
jgi:hypothetical protein